MRVVTNQHKYLKTIPDSFYDTSFFTFNTSNNFCLLVSMYVKFWHNQLIFISFYLQDALARQNFSNLKTLDLYFQISFPLSKPISSNKKISIYSHHLMSFKIPNFTPKKIKKKIENHQNYPYILII